MSKGDIDVIQPINERQEVATPGDADATITFCVEHFLGCAQEAIESRGQFTVALSGGSTPKVIYEKLTSPAYRNRIDWSKVLLFWSDERCVPADHPDSNYKMAIEAGFGTLPIPEENIFRMVGEGDKEQHARDYDALITEKIPDERFDLVMLGMGEDGHTASLFPKTHGLHTVKRNTITNFIPKFDTWRLSLTFECINAARHIAIYVLGSNKVPMLKAVLNGPYDPDILPIQRVGTQITPALWITDQPFKTISEG